MFDDEDNDQEGLFTRLLATLFMVLAVVVFGTLSLPRNFGPLGQPSPRLQPHGPHAAPR